METLTINNKQFNIEQTGGGCTALIYRENNLEFIITKDGEPNAPDSKDDRIDFGIYDIDGGVICVIYDTLIKSIEI